MTRIFREIFSSFRLGRDIPYRVLQSESRGGQTEDRPVLFLLHGLFGNCDNWTELTTLAERMDGRTMTVVLADGGDKWYSDGVSSPTECYETSFVEEFLPHVESVWNLGRKRSSRAIAGLSMGGYGALKFALKRPELFSFAGSMSGAFDVTGMHPGSGVPGQEELLPSVMAVFGEAESRSRIENDIFRIAETIPADDVPAIYLDCGIEDPFLGANERFAALLRSRGIAADFIAAPGGHDWDYWEGRLPSLLDRAEHAFRR